MGWIALKMLVGDRAKFLGIVLGLTFAALLITQQGSIFCGLMLRTCGQVTDITGADLWVMDPNVRFIDDVKPMLENNLYRVRGIDGVLWAVPLYKGTARVKINPDVARGNRATIIEQAILLGLDDATLVGAPRLSKMLAGNLRDLRLPDAIIVDGDRLQKLYPDEPWADLPRLGKAFYGRFLRRQLEMNDHRAVIVGVCEATKTFQTNPVVYTLTYSTGQDTSAPQERKPLLHPGEDRARRLSRGRLRPDRGDDRAGCQDELAIHLDDDRLLPPLHGYPVQLRDHGHAGLPGRHRDRRPDLLQLHDREHQAVRGLEGDGGDEYKDRRHDPAPGPGRRAARLRRLGVGLAAAFGWRIRGTELAYFTPWQLLPITAGAIVLICVLSSLLSVQRVIRLEPAIVFR